VPSNNAASFDTGADDVFGRLAGRYDKLCDLFSLGIHRYWKHRVAGLIAAEPCTNMLDAAAGTGDVALRVVRRDPALARRDTVVSDISPAMLRIAQRRIQARSAGPAFRVMDAHALAGIADASLDLYAISLALKICDRTRVMREAYRVLRPGGRFIALEASAIVLPWLHRLYLRYMDVPAVDRLGCDRRRRVRLQLSAQGRARFSGRRATGRRTAPRRLFGGRI
jgi:demethylmenaquinone methyltransferase/2-methoxy-6-polyprenyl-1,4-benzoquinol methylase